MNLEEKNNENLNLIHCILSFNYFLDFLAHLPTYRALAL